LGTDAFSGEVCEGAPKFDMTVSLCLPKTGVVTYPAKENAGRLVNCDIGLSGEWIEEIATDEYTLTDSDGARELLPERAENSSKGSFGRLAVITGSAEYMGAALLSVGGALRSGVGYLCYFGERESREIMLSKYPEVIFKSRPRLDKMTEGDKKLLVGEAEKSSAILIGCGCGRSAGLRALIYALLKKSGAPLIIDADGINVLSEDRENGLNAIKNSPRVVILTPHPLEFARLIGKDVSEVQAKRLPLARNFAEETGAILVLKGAATVTVGGGRCFVNSSGSSSLAKAGSGDVLAGVISSLIASRERNLTELCALGVYAHGRAGDILSGSYSTLGVLPSELPEAVGVALAELQHKK
jgi:NAD(P)H-hydrate epimerase